MNREDLWGLIPLVGIPLLWRLIDLLIPKGRHLRWIDRITVPDKEKEPDNEE